jgi:transposase
MLKANFTQDEIDELYYQFMGHPAGTAKKKLHVVYLKSLNLPHQDIALIARVSGDTVTRYLKEFNEGGLSAISIVRTYSPTSKLLPHKAIIKVHFQSNPPHTVSEASFEIERLTGLKLGLSACREFMLKHFGMKCRRMAAIPSKADPERQEVFLNNRLKPLLEEEKRGKVMCFCGCRLFCDGCFFRNDLVF